MQTGSAEIIELDEVRARSSGDGGGFDYFATMKIGTIFCVADNGKTDSLLTEYQLVQKQGLTVLLKNADELDTGRFERHIGIRFWKYRTLVQILYIPPEKEKEEENGNSA